MKDINKFIKKYRRIEWFDTNQGDRNLVSTRNPWIICKDGFRMSVQAGQTLYSKPKDLADRYEEVEIGFPSEPEELIKEYAENIWDEAPDYCDTVYPYVPVKVVNKVLQKHGGIDENAIDDNI